MLAQALLKNHNPEGQNGLVRLDCIFVASPGSVVGVFLAIVSLLVCRPKLARQLSSHPEETVMNEISTTFQDEVQYNQEPSPPVTPRRTLGSFDRLVIGEFGRRPWNAMLFTPRKLRRK